MFTKISYTGWERREIYEAFKNCVINATVQIDITELLSRVQYKNLKIYPTLVYCAARVANESPSYRYGMDERGNIGTFDVVHPLCTFPREGGSLFSFKMIPYSSDFEIFYGEFLRSAEKAESCGRLHCDDTLPENLISISTAPTLRFSSLALSAQDKTDLVPFITFGKYYGDGGKWIIPVSGEFAHGVNDGFHVGQYFEALEDLFEGLLR